MFHRLSFPAKGKTGESSDKEGLEIKREALPRNGVEIIGEKGRKDGRSENLKKKIYKTFSKKIFVPEITQFL